MKSLRRVYTGHKVSKDSYEVALSSLDTRTIAVKTLSRAFTAILLVPRLVLETGYQQDSCTVFRTGLGSSRIAVQSLEEESGYQQESCEVSRARLGSSRMAMKSIGRVWITAGWLCNL